MTDIPLPRLAEHAGHVLDNPAFQHVLDKLETEALEELLAVKGWRLATRDAKRQAIIDRVNAIRSIKAELELLQFHAKQAARRTA